MKKKKECTLMWKTIIYNNISLNYEVNSDGVVRNKETLLEIKGNIKKNGYVEYCLYHEGKPIYILGHIIVARAFIPNPDNKSSVNHINGNKQLNKVSNLEWVTVSENNQPAWDNGLNRPHVVRSVKQYDLNYNYLKQFDSVADAVRATGATKIREVCNGTRKTSGGYIWEWAEDFIPEDRGKKKQVAQLDNDGNIIAIFDSISEAARQTGANRKGISAVCLDKQKTCANYKWKFVQDDIVQ